MSRSIAALLAAFVVGAAHAQHLGDIALEIVDNTIATNAFGASGAVPERVFGATFGDTGVARFTSNPGFEALPGTFATGTRVGFTPRSGLLRFTGSAVEPVASERLEIKFLTLASVVGPDPVPGFSLAVQSNGGWHRHLNFRLFAEGGKLPSNGLYVVEFELYSNDGVTLPSAPFWIVFNDGKPATELNAALAWVESNLVGDASCPADLDGDGDVGTADLGILLSGWGTPDGDIDGDGLGDSVDLGQLLSAWGACP